MSDVSPGEVGGVFAGIIALLTILGKATGWLINWKGRREDSRAERLRAWEKSLDERERAHRAEHEARFVQLEERIELKEQKISMMAASLFEVIAEMQILDAASPALANARRVLRKAFPVQEDVPEGIAHLVRRFAEREGDGQI
jgi:hypothetical protein